MAAAAKLKTSSAQAQATCLLMINILKLGVALFWLENCGLCKRHVILVDSLEIVVISCTYGQFFRYILLLQRRSSSYSINKLIKKRLKELSPSFADGPAGGPRPGEQEWQQGVGQPRSQGDCES